MRNFGYIRLPRTINNWRWYKDSNTFCLYVHLLLMANFVDSEFETHEIKRGQYVTSLNYLCDDLGMSLQEVRTAIKHLKSTNEISVETTKKYSIFTVNDYEKFAASTNTSTKEDKKSTRSKGGQQYNNGRNNTYQNKTDNNMTFSIEDFEAKSLFND